MDGRRLALAHPRLAAGAVALLRIPALEDVVHEALDSFGALPDLESIQVVRGFAASAQAGQLSPAARRRTLET